MKCIYCRHCIRRPSDIEGSFGYGVWAVDMEWPFSFEVGFTKLWSQNPRGRGHLCGLGTCGGIILKWIWRELWGCGLNSGDYGKRPVAACFVHGFAVKRGRCFDQLSGYQWLCLVRNCWHKFFFLIGIIVGPSISNSLLIPFFFSAKIFLCLRHFWAGEVSVAPKYGLDSGHSSRRHCLKWRKFSVSGVLYEVKRFSVQHIINCCVLTTAVKFNLLDVCIW